MDTKARLAAAVAVMGTAGVWVASSAAGAGIGSSELIGSGPDYVYGASPVAGATVTVHADDIGTDGSQITLTVTGVDAPAGTEFGAHVHTNPCGATGAAAGPHLANAAADANLQHREVWLDFRVDAAGDGLSVATRDWPITDRANRSIVIHAMGTAHDTGVAGARLACVDLDA